MMEYSHRFVVSVPGGQGDVEALREAITDMLVETFDTHCYVSYVDTTEES